MQKESFRDHPLGVFPRGWSLKVNKSCGEHQKHLLSKPFIEIHLFSKCLILMQVQLFKTYYQGITNIIRGHPLETMDAIPIVQILLWKKKVQTDRLLEINSLSICCVWNKNLVHNSQTAQLTPALWKASNQHRLTSSIYLSWLLPGNCASVYHQECLRNCPSCTDQYILVTVHVVKWRLSKVTWFGTGVCNESIWMSIFSS